MIEPFNKDGYPRQFKSGHWGFGKGIRPSEATLTAAHSSEANESRRKTMRGRRPTDAVLAAAHTLEARARLADVKRGKSPSPATIAAAHTPKVNAKRTATRRANGDFEPDGNTGKALRRWRHLGPLSHMIRALDAHETGDSIDVTAELNRI